MLDWWLIAGCNKAEGKFGIITFSYHLMSLNLENNHQINN